MEHLVYMTTDPNTGKFYIGKHSKKRNDSYVGSGIWVKNCKKSQIKLDFFIVAKCQTEKDAYDFERKLIVASKFQYPNLCMNFADGGVGFPVGHNLGRDSPMKGKKHSQDTKLKIAQWGKKKQSW